MAGTSTDGADAPYWANLSDGRLSMQCCQGCGDWKWPAVTRCGRCGTDEPQWRELPFEAVVFSWTKVHYAFGGTDGIAAPYITVLAALPQAGNRRLFGLFEGDETQLDFDLPLVGRASTTRFGSIDIPSIRWRLA
ncbi:Zn-ribbon domain-containing OB-fold protein [Sphingobium sp. EM0848]|uniref:Zn-ribbon domain-containing OB-fold protein n=1 Tax=Sphingobium sp. EM0848 TaxID=2743473 RepID=UPI00159C661B|nr:hypothetical protein [Sphingobium sp. EM0848]